MRPPMSDTPKPLPRYGLAAACLGHAAIFGWAASVLPWRSGTSFAVTMTMLTVLHLLTAVAAASGKRTALVWSWRALSLGSFIAFAIIGWSMAAAALYVSKLYLRLGPTISGAIGMATVLLLLLTLPIAIWGALRTLPARSRSPRRLGTGALVLFLFSIISLPVASRAAQGEPVLRANSEVAAELSEILDAHTQKPPR